MNLFHTLTAVLLALVVASPLCCCAAEGPESAASSCCAATEEQDGHPSHVCVCASDEPRDAAKILDLPGNAGVPLAAAGDQAHLPEPAPPGRLAKRLVPRTGCDPPRLTLARFSRWLI